MSLSNSPKINYDSSGKPPERRNWQRPLLRITFFILLLAGIGLNIYAFLANNTANRLAGTDGQLSGLVQDEGGQPIPDAIVFIAASPNVTTTTGTDGRFQLTNIATGEQYLVVVYNEIGQGYVVDVSPEAAEAAYTYSARPRVWP